MTHATHEQRVCLVPALNGFRNPPASYYGTAAAGGAAGGPAGSTSMLFFSLICAYRLIDLVSVPFGRTNIASGWYIATTAAGLIQVRAFNGAATVVSLGTAGNMLTLEGQNVPYLVVGSYQNNGVNGVMSGWINGVSMGAPVSVAGAGFTAFAGPTTIGRRSNVGGTSEWSHGPLSDCGMLDAYDPATFVSTLYGNGAAGLSAMWLADLREGRYLTWPRAAAANSDWYWAARDAVLGAGTAVSWTDRYTGDVMTRFGQVQGAAFPARPI